jgi:LPS-assembly protein
LTITLRGKYFFDPFFGGALVTNRRNQFYPINTLSGFVYGSVPRRFSPVNLDTRYRPRRDLFVDFRTDIDTNGGGVRAMSTTFGLSRPSIQVFQSFYYTRAIELVGNLARFADPRGFEAGTVRGSQWSPSVFLGRPERGLFGGASFFFDFQKRPGRGNSSLISSTMTLGHAWDCCAVATQFSTFNVGLRKENSGRDGAEVARGSGQVPQRGSVGSTSRNNNPKLPRCGTDPILSRSRTALD